MSIKNRLYYRELSQSSCLLPVQVLRSAEAQEIPVAAAAFYMYNRLHPDSEALPLFCLVVVSLLEV